MVAEVITRTLIVLNLPLGTELDLISTQKPTARTTDHQLDFSNHSDVQNKSNTIHHNSQNTTSANSNTDNEDNGNNSTLDNESNGDKIDNFAISNNNLPNGSNPTENYGGPWTLKIIGQSPLTFLLENISKSSINLVYFLVTSNFLRSFKHQVNTIANLINLKDVSLEFVEVKNDIVHTGDALREFSERYSYHSDLVVLSEPTIFSEPLDNIFDAFKKQKLENDTHMMTYFAFKAPTHKNRAVCINNGSKVIQLFHTKQTKSFSVKRSDFVPNTVVSTNLALPSIFACRPSVIHAFQDNFDCLDLPSLINWMISKEEILNQTVGIKYLDGYLMPLKHVESYHSACLDALTGWMPATSATSFTISDNDFVNTKDFLQAIETSAKIEKSVALSGHIHLGKNIAIDSDCKILSSIVFHDVHIHADCTIKNCIIMPKCVIYAGSHLENLIVGENSHILLKNSEKKDNNKLEKINVIPANSKISEDSLKEDLRVIHHRISILMVNNAHSVVESEEDQINSTPESAANNSNNHNQDRPLMDIKHTIELEVSDVIMKAAIVGNLENATVDLIIIKNDHGLETHLFCEIVVSALCKCIVKYFSSNSDFNEQYFNSSVEKFFTLIQNWIMDQHTQIIAIDTIVNFGCENAFFQKLLIRILIIIFNDMDILSEEAIMMWYNELDASDYAPVRESLAKFIEFVESD